MATPTVPPTEPAAPAATTRPTGPAAAAMISAGIGTFTIGLMTSLAETSQGLKDALNWYNPSGPLSGKTGVGVLAWLVSWVVLNTLWRDRNHAVGRAFVWTLVLIALGFLLTFPPIFEAFARD